MSRVVLGRKGPSSMVKVRWTAEAPDSLSDLEVAEELGARWDGDELVVDDFEAFMDAYQMYEDGEYMIDND